MTKRETASVAIKLMLLYVLFKILLPMVYLFFQAYDIIQKSQTPGELFQQLALSQIPNFFIIVITILGIEFSDRIAAWIMPEGNMDQLIGLSYKECRTLGYHFLGLTFIIYTLPNLLSLLIFYMQNPDIIDADNNIAVEMRSGIFKGSLSILIGVALLLGSKFWHSTWLKFKGLRTMANDNNNN